MKGKCKDLGKVGHHRYTVLSLVSLSVSQITLTEGVRFAVPEPSSEKQVDLTFTLQIFTSSIKRLCSYLVGTTVFVFRRL